MPGGGWDQKGALEDEIEGSVQKGCTWGQGPMAQFGCHSFVLISWV